MDTYKGHHHKVMFRYGAVFFLLCMVFVNMSASHADSMPIISDEPQFFSALQDVPLMPGLEEIEEQGVFFDKPEGRIVESVALMQDLTEEKVLYFYHKTLPQLGWGKTSAHSFFRQKEFLEIGFEDSDQGRLVKIMIKPTL